MSERQPTEEEVAQHFAFEHARSIMAVPEDQMPDEAQRFELMRQHEKALPLVWVWKAVTPYGIEHEL